VYIYGKLYIPFPPRKELIASAIHGLMADQLDDATVEAVEIKAPKITSSAKH
jgi:hypothetical protein